MRRLPLLALLLLLGGCVYYNGMYNTKRLAGRARRAEREGRTFDATSLWGQVGVKAESVLARHPNSKWADEARLLQGTSYVKLRNCTLGMAPLEQVLVRSSDPDLTEEAAVLLGACRASTGDPDGAMAVYSRLTMSKDPQRRRLALFSHGRAQRLAGNYEAALAELDSTDYPGAQGERAAALAGLGRLPEAMVLADSLLATADSLAPWDALVASVARHDPELASTLTDRVAQSEAMPGALRAGLLFADGVRWRDGDPARSDTRMASAEKTAAGTLISNEVRFDNLRYRLRQASSPAELRALLDRIEDLTEGAGTVAPRAAQMVGFGRTVLLAADSVPSGSPGGDLRLFMAGEMARDSLAADTFAVQQFRRVVSEWSTSPFAPKALLALVTLQPAQADSLRALLLSTYASSPYVAMIQGGDSPEYAVLEDSLRRFSLGFGSDAGQLRPRPQPRPASPGAQVPQ